jgi:hypothetical protein
MKDQLKEIAMPGSEVLTRAAERAAKENREVAKNRHVVIALNHLNKRRDALLEKRSALTKEIEEIDQAILALG